MDFSLSKLFESVGLKSDPENPGSFKTSMFFENYRAANFLHDKFQLWAYDRGRAQLTAKRNEDGTYDIAARYHGRQGRAFVPEKENVLLGVDRDTAIATLYAFEETGILNDAPSDSASRQIHMQRKLDKLGKKSSHVVGLRKALGITNDSHLVLADKPIPRPPPPPPPPRPKQTDNPLLAKHMKGIKRKKPGANP